MQYYTRGVERWESLKSNFNLSWFKKKQFYIHCIHKSMYLYARTFTLQVETAQLGVYIWFFACKELTFTGATIVLSSQYFPNSYTNSYIVQFISLLCALNKVGKGVKGLYFGMQNNQKPNPENEKRVIGMCQCFCNILPLIFLHCKNPACNCVSRMEIKANLLSCLMNVVHQLKQWPFCFLVLLFQ